MEKIPTQAYFLTRTLESLWKVDLLNIPKGRKLPGSNVEVPMVIIGDEGFPLKTYLMRPYPGANLDGEKIIYNYRLCRARRVSENAFDILQQKFRIYARRLQGTPENLSVIFISTCVLYNYIRKHEQYPLLLEGDTKQITNSEMPEGFQRLRPIRGRAADAAFQVKDLLKSYFVSPAGAVKWQDRATEI